MREIQATLVISPRERFSMSERALAAIYEHTPEPFELIYATGGAPDPVYKSLKKESRARGFELIHSEKYLSPSQARNQAIPKIRTKYAVFLDNDALVAPGWLENLIRCAEETQADIVGPLYLIGEFRRATIHMAGGMLTPESSDGRKILCDEQFLYDTPIARANPRLRRRACDYVEFHCMLVRTDFFERTGLLDEALLNLHEERDICLLAKEQGRGVYMEPSAVVTYVAPPPIEWWDLPYFMLRWSEEWSVNSVQHFNRKWHIDAVQHISDRKASYEDGTVVGFASAWRSRVAGMAFSCVEGEVLPSPTEQSQLMVALLASVHREYFDYEICDAQGVELQASLHTATPGLIMALAELTPNLQGMRVTVRPLRRHVANEPVLICVGDLSSAQADDLKPLSLMVLQHGSKAFQCWFAISQSNWNDAAIETKYDGDQAKSRTVCLAGSLSDEDSTQSSRRIELVCATVGNMLSNAQLREPGLIELLNQGEVW